MKKKILCALALACLCFSAPLDAQISRPDGDRQGGTTGGNDDPRGESGNTAPELDAKSAGAGLVLLAGGVMIVLGRRRKARA